MDCKLWFYDNGNSHSLHSSTETITTEQERVKVLMMFSPEIGLDCRLLGGASC